MCFFFTPFLVQLILSHWHMPSNNMEEHHGKMKLLCMSMSLWASMAFLAAMPTAPGTFGRWLFSMVGFVVVAMTCL